MIVFQLTLTWRLFMSYIQIERLKKDRNEALYYQKKLIKKGTIYLDDVLKRFSDDAGEFVSEIDWAKWNK